MLIITVVKGDKFFPDRKRLTQLVATKEVMTSQTRPGVWTNSVSYLITSPGGYF